MRAACENLSLAEQEGDRTPALCRSKKRRILLDNGLGSSFVLDREGGSMFDAKSAAEIIALCEQPLRGGGLSKSLDRLAVYGFFAKGSARPLHDPTHVDIQLAAEALAKSDPGYLDDLMLYPFECLVPDDSMTAAAQIARVARMRVEGGLTGEPWALSVDRLGEP